MVPLAGPANKQARILADNLCGAHRRYKGSMGTAIARVFDLSVASVGLNEKQLNQAGKVKHEDYETVLINQGFQANYQIVVTRDKAHQDNIEVIVEMTPFMVADDTFDKAQATKKLVAGLKAMLGIYAQVTLVDPKSLERSEGKAVRVIDKRGLYQG